MSRHKHKKHQVNQAENITEAVKTEAEQTETATEQTEAPEVSAESADENVAETVAETTETVADTPETAAETIKATAENVETVAETVETAAETVETAGEATAEPADTAVTEDSSMADGIAAAEEGPTDPQAPPMDQGISGHVIEPPKKSAGLKFSLFISQAVNIIALLVFIGCAIYLGKVGISYLVSTLTYNHAADNIISDATPTPVPTTVPEPVTETAVAEITATPTPTPIPAEHESYNYTLKAVNFDALAEETDDAIGWIDIPSCDISYPIMQSDDNEYYLRHTYTGLYNVSGSIFLDSKMNPDFDAQKNTLIYGHNQNNGKMFSNLHRLEEEDFAMQKDNQLIVIYFPDQVKYYTIFSVRVRPKTDSAYYMAYKNIEQYQTYIDNALSQSNFDFDRNVTTDDQIISLVTCMDNTDYRLVVNAVEIE